MNKKCPNCRLVNYPTALKCGRCDTSLGGPVRGESRSRGGIPRILIRAIVCVCVCLAILFGFYLSLIGSAKSLTLEQKATVRDAIKVLSDRGFPREATLLDTFTVYRSNDKWLNASVENENAFTATNFRFEIMTLYPDFFAYPYDDTERAAILLHEARHLQGSDEKDAYEFVWKNRQKLGWTKEKYFELHVWKNVRKQTREVVPALFTCDNNDFGDCTE